MNNCDVPPGAPPPFDEIGVDETVQALRALAHPVRLRIVETIARQHGELCVCQIQAGFKLSQPTISHHLRVLRNAGIVSTRQDGTWVHYGLEGRAFARLANRVERMACASPKEVSE